jgi:hypothetical protein
MAQDIARTLAEFTGQHPCLRTIDSACAQGKLHFAQASEKTR